MGNILKAVILGIIEGITEWLPVSSTGHMILADEFIKLDVSAEFMNMFLVVIQLGAIMAVVVLYFTKLLPFKIKDGKIKSDTDTWIMWLKIFVSCVPRAIVGILFDDWIDEHFYNWQTVSRMLIIFGVLFVVVEAANRYKTATTRDIDDITLPQAFAIGLWQLVAAVFPGTSRSGATIIGSLLLGIRRDVAAEYTFFLAVPVMFGRSALKILKYGFAFTGSEIAVLITGMLVAFMVSVAAIKFLMGYIRKHSFTAFGIYRIILGLLVIVYFAVVA